MNAATRAEEYAARAARHVLYRRVGELATEEAADAALFATLATNRQRSGVVPSDLAAQVWAQRDALAQLGVKVWRAEGDVWIELEEPAHDDPALAYVRSLG